MAKVNIKKEIRKINKLLKKVDINRKDYAKKCNYCSRVSYLLDILNSVDTIEKHIATIRDRVTNELVAVELLDNMCGCTAEQLDCMCGCTAEQIDCFNTEDESTKFCGKECSKGCSKEEKDAIEDDEKAVTNYIDSCSKQDADTSKKFVTADEIKFTDIQPVNIGTKVGNLPVITKFKSKSFDTTIEVTEKMHAIVKAGSLICKSKQSVSDRTPEGKIRKSEIEKGTLVNKNGKYLVTEDIAFESIISAKRFIIGRVLNTYDNSYELMVGNITLERYLKMGNET